MKTFFDFEKKSATYGLKKVSGIFLFFLLQISFSYSQTFTPKASFLGQWAFATGVAHQPTNSIYIPGVYQFGDIDQFVRYNIATNTWSVVAGAPATKSEFGFAFNVSNRIFFGGGVDQPGTFTNVVWEFTPPNTFATVDNIPNGPASSFSFTVGSFAYVGEGLVAGFGNSNTFYKFNPAGAPGTQWSIATSYPGSGDINCGSCSLNGFGYAGLGRSNPGSTEYSDFWRYDPNTGVGGTWTPMAPFPGAGRECPIITSQCNKLILIGGVTQTGTNYNDMWEFDPANGPIGTWTFLGTNGAVWGPQSGRYGPAFADYGDSLFFGMGYGASNVNSDWNLYNYCASVLPVELSRFTAQCDDNKIELDWTTASETNNNFFTVKRTNDGINYSVIGTVDGSGTSTHEINYSFVDPDPLPGINYYQLTQTDFNGQSQAFTPVSVTNCSSSVNQITFYPNPVTGDQQLQLQIELTTSDNVTIEIYDALGQRVFEKKAYYEKGSSTLSIDSNDLGPGMYFIKSFSENGLKLLNSKFIKE